jgi:predicted MFS family arabinose efflux permease
MSEAAVSGAIADERFASTPTLAVLLGAAILGPAIFLILPAFVGALADTFGFSEGQLGLLASADLIGMSVAAATGLYWVPRWSWRRVVGGALVVVVLGNLASTLLATFATLISLRVVVGFAGGMIMAIVMSYMARRDDPNRAAAILFICQVSFIVVALASLPPVVAAYGVDAIFVILAALTSVLFLFISRIPVGAPRLDIQVLARGVRRLPGIIVLASMALFFVAQAGLWGFVELMGEDKGISPGEVGAALALSTLISLAGPIYGATVGERFGRKIPLVFSAVVQFIAMAGLIHVDYGFIEFLIILSLYQLGWNLPLSYQFSVMVHTDLTRRLVVLVPSLQGFGIALGPMIMGFGVEAYDYTAVPIIAAAFMVLYCFAILPFSGMSALTGARKESVQ